MNRHSSETSPTPRSRPFKSVRGFPRSRFASRAVPLLSSLLCLLSSAALRGPSILACLGLSSHAQPWAPSHPAQGEALARQFCQGCHLFSSPDLLDQQAWVTTLRRMAPLLGAARINLDRRPDGVFLAEAHLFPQNPLLSEEEWTAITRFYLQSAPKTPIPQPPRPAIQPTTPGFQTEIVTLEAVEPAITLVQIESSQHRFLLGDGRRNALHAVSGRGRWLSSTPVPSAPVALTRHGQEMYLTLIGDLFPSDLRSGQILHLLTTSNGITTQPLLSQLQRPVHCAVLDLDDDGAQDLVVAQFGNYLGKLSGYLRKGSQTFSEDVLIEFPGALRIEVRDLNQDQRPDMVVLFGQAREGISLLSNRGKGAFDWEPWLHFPPAYGSTGFELADFDRDGSPDILHTNGDNGDYPSPFKAYHGVRIFRNDGHNRFSEAWFYPLNGAFKAIARDFDGDGDLDIAAISFFPDYLRSPEESFVYLENHGDLRFTASSIPEATVGRWLTMDAGDLDGDGDLDLVLGSFVDGPRTVPIPAPLQESWERHRAAAVILRNRTHSGPMPDR